MFEEKTPSQVVDVICRRHIIMVIKTRRTGYKNSSDEGEGKGDKPQNSQIGESLEELKDKRIFALPVAIVQGRVAFSVKVRMLLFMLETETENAFFFFLTRKNAHLH